MSITNGLLNANTELRQHGFLVISTYLPETTGLPAFSHIGAVLELPGLAEVQVLTPRHENATPPNTYSGNFGFNAFPLHSDLAHWFLPPRYLALRCVVGTQEVATRLIDSRVLIASVGENDLRRALVRPRRPFKRNRPLLRLLSRSESGATLFRWDSLFLVPETDASAKICETVAEYLDSSELIEVLLGQPGDTLIVDNWRMLHGRSPVSLVNEERQIERAYFGAID